MYIIYPIQKDTYITNKKLNGVDGRNANFGKASTLDLYKTYNENTELNSTCLFRLNEVPIVNEVIEFQNTFNQTIQLLIDVALESDDPTNGTTNIDGQYLIGIAGIVGINPIAAIVEHIKAIIDTLDLGINVYIHAATGLISFEQKTKGILGDKTLILQNDSEFQILRNFSRVEESTLLLKADLPANNEYFAYSIVQGNIKVYLELHDITTSLSKPRDYTVEALPLTKDFNEGLGRDVYALTDIDAANWLYCDYNGNTNEKIEWETAGEIGLIEGTIAADCDILTSFDDYDFKGDEKCQAYIAEGNENIVIDVTSIYEKYWLSENALPDKGLVVKFINEILWNDETYFAKRLGTKNLRNRHLRSCLKILIDDVCYNIPVEKDFYFNEDNKIFLYNKKGNKAKNIQKLEDGQIVSISTGPNNNGIGDIRLKIESVILTDAVPPVPVYGAEGWAVKQAKDIRGNDIIGTYYSDFNIDTFTNPELVTYMFENDLESLDFKFTWYWWETDEVIFTETKTLYRDTLSTDTTFKRLRASVKLYSPDLGMMNEIHKIAVTFFDLDVQYDYVKVRRELPGLDVGDVFYEVIDADTLEVLVPSTEELNATKCLKENDHYWFPFFNSDVFYGRRLQFIFKLKQQEQNNLIVNANEVFRVGNNG